MKRILLTALGGLSILLGLATVWLPLPTGLPLLAFGVFLLIATHSWAARLVRRMRDRSQRLNTGMTWVEDRTRGHMARVLRLTRPRARKRTAGKAVKKPMHGADATL